ncbi:MATE family efflux transporter [Pseudomonadota bacterium]
MSSAHAKPRYLEGSIWQHIVRMTASSGFGLLALFTVDLVDLFFISLLGEQALAAAVGFAAALMFFNQSISIGLSIAMGAVVSRALGAKLNDKAAELVGSGTLMVFISSLIVTCLFWWFREPLLIALGASGQTLVYASEYLAIVLLAFPFVSVGMAMGGVMRARGDAKGALWLSLWGAIVNAILDPILIFGLDMGLNGAAWASSISRMCIFLYGVNKVLREYQLYTPPSLAIVRRDLSCFCNIAIPSVLTNLATPVGVAYVTATIAQFGDSAVAGNAIITRLQLVAFVGLYALSGVVGPIAGQNWGANNYPRVMSVLNQSLLFVFLYCLVVCALMVLLTPWIITLFQASPDAAELIRWFTYGLSLMFIFHGFTFVTNALFNNLGAPKTATLFNIAKVTIFTMPFVWVGAQLGEAPGVLIGQAVGAVIISFAGWYWCARRISRLPLMVRD